MMVDLRRLTIKQFIKLVRSGEINLERFYKELMLFIEEKDRDLLAFQVFDRDFIEKQMSRLKKEGKNLGQLYGIPISVKDVINTISLPTERGSVYWKGYFAGNNARIVDKVIWEGGVIVGKTVTAELAVNHPGETKNPHNYDYSPGTSSMGSAVAVAAGMSMVSLGTQTGASIIRPASYTGVFGYKPSYGLIPRTGVLKTTDTLDHIGFFANNIEDIILFFDILKVRGKNYPISQRKLSERALVKKEITIGILRPEYLWKNYSGYVKTQFEQLINSLRNLRAVIVADIEDDGLFDSSHFIHSTIYNKSLAYYFRKESSNKDVISSTLYKMVSQGEQVSVKQFQDALSEQEKMQSEFDKMYQKYDIILTPSTAKIASKRDNYYEIDDTGLIWSLLGVPALNIPAFRGLDNMPFGLQAIGVKYSDYRLLYIIKKFIQAGYLTLDTEIRQIALKTEAS